MCGFLAITGNYRNKISDDEAHKLLRHRGPDDFQVFRTAEITIYFARLAIIDPNGPGQPMLSSCNRFVSVLNGEIYNYKSLRQNLLSQGIPLNSNGDAEVIPNLFAIHGVNFVQQIEGMFSIVIWDTKEKKLYFFRDRIGVKPFYYTSDNHSFACSSEIKPLRLFSSETFGIESINKDSVEEYLAFGYLPSTSTIFNKILKIPAGHYGLWDQNNFILQNYWMPQFTNRSTSEVGTMIQKVIDDHLISDVPVGIFLSGGLDSALIAAIASDKIKNLEAYTIKFEESTIDESQVASEIAKKYQLSHHIINVKVDDLVKLLPQIFWVSDEPNADSGILPSYYLSKIARANGSIVVLSGAGGDEIFGGYNYYLRNRWEKKLGWLGFLNKLTPGTLKKNSLMSKLLRSTAFKSNPSLNFFYHRCLFGKEMVKNIPVQLSLIKRIMNNYFPGENSKKRMITDLKTYLPEELLALLDRVTMANSIEGRVPYCDHRLVELLFSLPEKEIFQVNERKGFLKKFAKKYLPESIYNLPKSGFNSPVNTWILNKENAELVENTLFNEKGILKSILTTRLTREKFKQFNFYQKWGLFALEIFFRIHIVNDRSKIIENHNLELSDICK